jgi:hypothetical protein
MEYSYSFLKCAKHVLKLPLDYGSHIVLIIIFLNLLTHSLWFQAIHHIILVITYVDIICHPVK